MNTEKSIINLLLKLISIPSLSGHEKEISLFVYDYLSKIGLNPKLQEVYKTGYNVLVKLGKGDKLLICGHLDTVAELDMVNPFTPVLKNGEIHGRGACDMKGGVAVMISLLEECLINNLEPDVTFAFVVDEEMHGRGAMELIASGISAKECIILEPTALDVCIGGAGCIEFTVKVYGRSGHGAAAIKQNIIQKLFTKLNQLFDKINNKFEVGDFYPIINLGSVKGGFGGWVIPPKSEANILIHFHPEFRFADVEEFIENEFSGDESFEIEVLHGCDGFISPISYTDLLVESHRNILGSNPYVRIFESESDANALYHKGGVKSVIYGPGQLAVAHSSNEGVEINQLVKARDVLLNLLKNI
jgi:acetylornithine deacetylase/succinyl-diaminopimelate desuccinylase-like protein